MADILIKGMEMPTSCEDCSIKSWDCEGYVCPFSGIDTLNIGRQRDCPLAPVPEHGRLIDADVLMEDVRQFIKENMLSRDDARELLEIIDDAPTIIPADKEETCTKN